MGTKIHVGGLPYSVTDGRLSETFSAHLSNYVDDVMGKKLARLLAQAAGGQSDGKTSFFYSRPRGRRYDRDGFAGRPARSAVVMPMIYERQFGCSDCQRNHLGQTVLECRA
jgi:hypothetical protein